MGACTNSTGWQKTEFHNRMQQEKIMASYIHISKINLQAIVAEKIMASYIQISKISLQSTVANNYHKLYPYQ